MKYSENKEFFKTLLHLAIPIATQELVYSFINLLDTFMVGQLGDERITAVGLANQIFFIFFLILFGINSGASIFMSQYWGKKDIDGIHKVMGISISSGMVIGIIFACTAFFFPHWLMGIYSKDPIVCKLGAEYLKVFAISYLIYPVSICFNQALKSTGKTSLPMKATLIALIINFSLNLVLIFGLLGAPRLEVAGAALATVIARFIESIIVIYFAYKHKLPVAGKLQSLFSFDFKFLKIFYKTAAFVIINETLWGLGTSIYNIAYKHTGTTSQTAVQISMTIQNLFFVMTIGIGAASAIMLGNLIGANENKKAISYSRKLLVVSAITGILMGISLAALSSYILLIFKITPVSSALATKTMLVISCFLPIKFITHNIIVGILRSGADTVTCFIMDCGAVWLVGVPMAFIGAVFLKLPIYWVVALVYTEEFIKIIFGIPRVLSNKWINNVVKDNSALSPMLCVGEQNKQK